MLALMSVLLAIVLAPVLFLIAAYLLPAGEQIAPPLRDEPIWDIPADRHLDAQEIAAVRLPVALRGYRFAETDRLLDRLGEELDRRDAEIATLRAGREEHAERFEAADAVPAEDPAEDPAEPQAEPSPAPSSDEADDDADDGH